MTPEFMFEMLPDEMILQVCSYLRCSDVLYAFLNLNSRLNLTIIEYCRYVNLMAVSHYQFNHVVSELLPLIGSSIRTFVLNGNWEVIISPKACNFLFTSSISIVFSQLKKLTLKLFTGKRLLSFLNNITNVLQLTELDVRFLKDDADEMLVNEVFACNNKRLRSISFDNDCIALSVPEVSDKNLTFLNIQELRINLESIQCLTRLFTLVPNLTRLHLCVEKSWYKQDNCKLFTGLSSLIYLTDFHLRFVNFLRMFDDIKNILSLMPVLQTLILDLWTDDERLIHAEHLTSILPSCLQQFHFLIRCYVTESSFKIDQLLKSWPNHMQVDYYLNEDDSCILLYTIPCYLNSTIISASISKNSASSWKCVQQIEDLQISNVKSINEILSIVKHLHRLRTLAIDAENQPNKNTISLTQSIRLQLSWLKKVEIRGVCDLFHLLQAAPNIEYLIADDNCIKHLLDDEPTCNLLKTRITRLEIFQVETIDSDQLERIACVFNRIMEFILNVKISKVCIESIILAVLIRWNKRQLFSLHVGGLMSSEVTENLQEWIMNNSYLTKEHSFAIVYKNNWFSLWW